MIEEIFLRIVGQEYRNLQMKIAEAIKLDSRVSLVDDSLVNPIYKDICSKYREIICISPDITFPASYSPNPISFFKISRVFDESGNHIGWFIPSLSKSLIGFDSPLLSKPIHSNLLRSCIIDSDIATGSTRELVLRLFSGAEFFAPIHLMSHQDLLDIEDLVLDRTLVWNQSGLKYVSYLHNVVFFSKRTSILPNKYPQILKLVQDSLPKKNFNL